MMITGDAVPLGGRRVLTMIPLRSVFLDRCTDFV